MSLILPVRRLPHAADLPLPAYQTDGAAGMDLAAALGPGQTLIVPRHQHRLAPTGLVFQIPQGYEGQVRPRSGLAVKSGITVLNSPGTIDADYRGEVQVILINLGSEDFTITHGMRIAQIVFAPVSRMAVTPVETVDETTRGQGGFGSTGVARRHPADGAG